jgi:23S rRNA pseudouridine955/2504/2580 synthase
VEEFIIGKHQAGQKSFKYLSKLLNGAPSGFLHKMMRKKNIVLNDRKMTGQEVLKESDSIKIYFSHDTFVKFASHTRSENSGKPEEDHRYHREMIPVIYEDENYLVLNKPAGMLSQKAKQTDYSVNEWILSYLLDTGSIRAEDLRDFRPSICNRLDRNTSGLILAGKTILGLQELSHLLKDRTAAKFYRCVVCGTMREGRHLTGWLAKDRKTNRVSVSDQKLPGSVRIETVYEPLQLLDGYTELRVHLITGRSHQIRAHLAAEGHPILGDPKYGDSERNQEWRRRTGLKRQLLHAWRMEFPDGTTVTAEVPEDYKTVIKELNR